MNSGVVVDTEGVQARIVPSSSSEQNDASQTLLQLENGQRILVPTDALVERADGNHSLPFSLNELSSASAQVPEQNARTVIIPVMVEEAHVEKRIVETGGIRVHKQVHSHDEVIDEPLLQETVSVERVAINRVVEDLMPVRQEGDTVIVPVLEEVMVVEKRLMLKEELHITRTQVTTHNPQSVTLRQEEVSVERFEFPAEGPAPMGTTTEERALPQPSGQAQEA